MTKTNILRFLAVYVAIPLALLCTACRSDGTRSLLWYQSEMSAAILTEKSGLAWRIVLRPDGFSAEMVAPQSVAGIVYTVAGTAATIRAGETIIPATEQMLVGARRAASCLMLKDDQLSGIESSDGASEWAVLAHCRGADAEYDVAIGSDGLPLWIEMQSDRGTSRYQVSVELPPDDGISSAKDES